MFGKVLDFLRGLELDRETIIQIVTLILKAWFSGRQGIKAEPGNSDTNLINEAVRRYMEESESGV